MTPRLVPLPQSSEQEAAPMTPRWVRHLQLIAERYVTAEHSTPPALEQLGRDLWQLLQIKLHTLVAAHAGRVGGLPAEDVEEVVSEKALDLMRQIDSSRWKPQEKAPGEVINYIQMMTRNGVVDRVRKLSKDRTRHIGRDVGDLGDSLALLEPSPEEAADSDAVAGALVTCAGQLSNRQRTVWISRTFYGLSSKETAKLEAVNTTPGNVDVIFSRTRERIKKCLESKSVHAKTWPQGCFTAVWRAFEMEGLASRGPTDV